MKEVIAVYDSKGRFKQYLLKSEIRLVLDIIKALGQAVSINTVLIDPEKYKAIFGK